MVEAVNVVGSENCTVNDQKTKKVKWKGGGEAESWQNVVRTGGAFGIDDLTPFWPHCVGRRMYQTLSGRHTI